MRFPRRAPRQVYRVLDEDDFLAGDPPPSGPPATTGSPGSAPGARTRRDFEPAGEPSRRPRARLAPALVLAALIAAGAIAVDAVSTLRRGRVRAGAKLRTPVPVPAITSPARRSAPPRRHRPPRRAAHRVRTPQLGRPGDAGVGRNFAAVPIAAPRASGAVGEFSFERRVAR